MVANPFETAVNRNLKTMDDRLSKMEQKIGSIEIAVSNNLKNMDDRLCKMEEKMNTINNSLNQVVAAILGNPLTKQGGLMEEIELIKKEVEYLKQNACDKEEIKILQSRADKAEKFRDRIGWTVMVIIAIAVVAEYVVNFIVGLLK